MSLVEPSGSSAPVVNIPNPFTATEAAVTAQRNLFARDTSAPADASPLASPDLMQALGSLFDVIQKEENPAQPTLAAIPDAQLNVNPTNVDTSFGDAMLSAIEMSVQQQLDQQA